MSSPDPQDTSTEQDTATEAESAEADATAPDEEASESADPIECPNCGRTFSGTYCPDCGQKAGQSLTMTAIASDALGAVSNVEGGLRSTLVTLTLQPRHFFEKYLGGERKQFMSPGRYLTIAVLLYIGCTQAMSWLGVEQSISTSLMGIYGEKGDSAANVSAQLVQSQWFSIAVLILTAGILALILRRLFDRKLNRGSEALATGVFLISHASILSVGGRLLYAPSVYFWTGEPADPMFYSLSIGALITIFYAGLAAHYSFGKGWKSAVKSVLGAFWAYVEAVGIGSITLIWYFFWSLPNFPPLPDNVPADEQASVGLFVVGLITAVYLLPLLLHAAVETYYRLTDA